MRKLIVLVVTVASLAVAGGALAGQPATDGAGDFIDLNVAATPPVAGTARAPRGVGVSFDSFTGNRINGDTSRITTSIRVRFNRGFKENGLFFPACQINPKAVTQCARSTQIGTGTTEAELPGKNGAAPTFVPATLAAYNGKPYSGRAPSVIFIASLSGKPTAELDFTARQQSSGPYGLAFTQIQFPGFPTLFDITKFRVNIPDRVMTRKVHGKSVKVHLIDAPTTCHGSWQFAQINTFADQPALTATDSQPCTSR